MREAATPEERAAIYRLRYDIYSRELRKDFLATVDHECQWIKDPEDDWPETHHFYVPDGDGVCAALRVIVGSERIRDTELLQVFHLDRFATRPIYTLSFSHRLVAVPGRRGSLRVGALMCRAREVCLAHGGEFNFCYAQVGLVPRYLKLGYRMYAANFQMPGGGLRVPLVMVFADLEHLRRVSSPFRAGSRPSATADTSVQFFREHFGHYAQAMQRLAETDGAVFEALGGPAPLWWERFSAGEQQALLARGCLLQLESGETLIQSGVAERDLYILVDGALEVVADPKDPAPLAMIQAGEVVGEMSYLLADRVRTATVRAMLPCKVVVIRERVIDGWLEREPRLAAKFFYLLSETLARRVRAAR